MPWNNYGRAVSKFLRFLKFQIGSSEDFERGEMTRARLSSFPYSGSSDQRGARGEGETRNIC